ncbi:unnamed protein product [Miscanthus lutarioriparius]|uniref:Uncharacterized protein n=1 Tax=Miscanthus lutarioriparius TaxID=422564 RepID=A0A811P8M9_9POAL|nr:unnamed protein product [Miscanthus lutarioriparius]
MELRGRGRGPGDRVRRQLQSVGRLAAYFGGGFLLFSAASSVAVRSLRALSDANQCPALRQRKYAMPCGACEGKGTHACRLSRGSATVEWSPMHDPVFVNPCLCPTCDGTRLPTSAAATAAKFL